jgi:hypothetical protein
MNEHEPEERDPAGALAEGESLTRVRPERGRCGGTRFRIAGGGGLESVPLPQYLRRLSLDFVDLASATRARRRRRKEAEPLPAIGPRNWSDSAERRILGAVDDDWLVGGSSRMLLRLSGQRRLVAGVKIAAGA